MLNHQSILLNRSVKNWLNYCKFVDLNKKWELSSQDLEEKSETEKNYWENLASLKLETSSSHSGRTFLCLTLEWPQRSKNLYFTVPHSKCRESWALLFPVQMAGKGERAAESVPDIVRCIYTHTFMFVFKRNKKTLPGRKTSFITHIFALETMKG